MDGDSTKKRAREAKAKANQQQQKKKRTTTTTIEADCFDDDVDEKFNLPPPARELGVFEFPWQKEGRPIGCEIDGGGGGGGNDLRDVFFASLVDGCRAAIGFPGDRLSPTPAPIDIPDCVGSWPSDAEPDGIWSCALREPLSVYSVVW